MSIITHKRNIPVNMLWCLMVNADGDVDGNWIYFCSSYLDHKTSSFTFV